MSDDFIHDVSDCCGCDLCLAADPAFDDICDARRDAWIADMDAAAAAQRLPWELGYEPGNDAFDAGEAA
jgi:hypothetical protein